MYKFCFNITDDNKSFSIIIPAHWESEFADKIIDELSRLLNLKTLDLHANEVRKRGDIIKIGDKEYKVSDFDNQKYEILEELKNVKYNDLAALVYRMQLTYDEIIDVLDLKYISTKRIGFSLDPGIYGIVDLNNTSKYILPDNVDINVTIDVIRL